MTHHEFDLSELLDALRAGEMTDTIRASVEWVLQQLIEAEAAEVIGAAPFERSETRTAQRNGYRPRLLATKAGDIELKIPKLRTGSLSRRCSRNGPTSASTDQKPNDADGSTSGSHLYNHDWIVDVVLHAEPGACTSNHHADPGYRPKDEQASG